VVQVTVKDILFVVIIPLALAELGPWCGWLAVRIMPLAARLRYGDTERAAVRLEEWTEDLNDIPGQLTKLAYAVAQLAAGSVESARRKAAHRVADSSQDVLDVRPAAQLLKVAEGGLMGLSQLVLLAEQRLAYEIVLHAVDRAYQQDRKTVVIVTGGPGSGKSAIGLALLGELARQGRPVLHATGSRSFTQTLRYVAKGSPGVKNMFKYFNSFMDAPHNGLDVLICDEAHRIRETSMNRYTQAGHRSDRPQIDELMSAARVPVFLLDQYQSVLPGEIGTVEQIRRHAAAKGLAVRRVHLDRQFRCGSSGKYEEWVLALLGLAGKKPVTWTGGDGFELSVAGSPNGLEATLQDRLTAGYSARITAGYCWPWSALRADGSLVPDVSIGDWSRPWNLKGDRALGGIPPAALWATDPAGFGQVGCIYTAQGFEYDWNGVIVGPDLVWRDGHWVTVRDANKDPSLRKASVPDREFGRLIRNVYKVLLTRGMVGTVIYSPDPETQAFLAGLVP
jgi:uncharacterized protein